MERLQCVAQTYAWGKHGRESRVAQLMEGSDPTFHVSEDGTYAELWMGTHPSGPAKVVLDSGEATELLSDWLKNHPAVAGAAASNGDLPFLFKVLSVEKALSIQAHPDLKLARSLHAKFPTIYKDPNHKPEMAIALTRFEALCQFRTFDEIVAHFNSVPELRAIASEEAARALSRRRDTSALREYFRAFIHASHDAIVVQIASLRKRLEAKSPSSLSEVDALVLRLIGEYGDDIGCFCPYLLNYITLQPGEAIFLGANEPHAYLSGDCIECMACSDNVVRAGLTPKFIDKETLYEMLTYRTGRPAILSGDHLTDSIRVYSPPVPEFEVEVVTVDRSQPKTLLNARRGASVLLVVSGAGDARLVSQERSFSVGLGQVYLIGAGETVEIEASSESSSPFVAYRAFPNEGTGFRE